MKQKRISHILWHWLPLAMVIIILAGTGFIAFQQSLRTSANESPIQLSEDYALMIKDENPQADLSVYTKVDMEKSLSPFLMILDKDGEVLQSTGSLGTKTVVPPKGSLEHAKINGQNRVTWAPKPGVRIATVITYVDVEDTYFIVSGRNLRETDRKINQVRTIISAGAVSALVMSLALFFLGEMINDKKTTIKKKADREL